MQTCKHEALEDEETSSTSAAKRLLLQKIESSCKYDTIKYNSLLASVACTSLKELLMTNNGNFFEIYCLLAFLGDY